MRPLPRTLAVTLAGLAATASLGLSVAAPATATPAVTLTAHGLPKGPAPAGAHLEGKTIVDGAVRVTVQGPEVRLLGKSGTSYVVGTNSAQGGHGRIWRVAPDGTRALLAKAHPFMTILSGDGATIVTTTLGRTAASTVTAYDVASGALKAKRVFRDYAVALDAHDDRVVLGNTKRTQVWTTSTDKVATVSQDAGYVADLAADVMGTFTKDPYDGGCSEVRRISTGERLWRSCTEQVAAFNADASRIATIGILSDGPGPGRVDARTITGHHLGRYQVRTGWFGEIRFESPTALLMDVDGGHKAFTARCTGTDCELAGDLRPAQHLRTS